MACPAHTHVAPTWVDVVDSTNGRDGTRFNRAFFLDIQQYIDELAGVYYGLPSPANIAEEIAAARGNRDCLDERLDVAMDEDGNLKIPTTVATKNDVAALVGENLCGNDLLVILPGGAAAAPLFWDAGGALGSWSTSFASGFGQTTVVGGASPTTIYQALIPPSMITRARILLPNADGIAFGVFVSTNQSGVRAFVTDGTVTKYSTVHPAGGSAVWLKVDPVPINPSSQYLNVGIEVPAGVTLTFFAPMASIGPVAPKTWKPAPTRQVITPFNIVGNALTAYTGATKFAFGAPGDGILESLWMGASTAMPAAHDATFTLSRYNGSGWDAIGDIALLAAQQFQYEDVALAVSPNLSAIAPRTGLTPAGRMFAWGLAVNGAGPHASDIFVAARWKVWERPLYTMMGSGV